jgi:2-phospho-L-lactate guanylyltransferase (CobY/MobA/RfbA family)
MGLLIVRWELEDILHLMLHQVNAKLEEATNVTVVVAAEAAAKSARSNLQLSDWRI